jgi:uncharacterized membrane protein YgaE (UPF0421/DUF939 family)
MEIVLGVMIAVVIAAVVILLFLLLEAKGDKEFLYSKIRYLDDLNSELRKDICRLKEALQQSKQDELETLFKALSERESDSDVQSEVEQHFKFIQGVEKLRVMIAERYDDE